MVIEGWLLLPGMAGCWLLLVVELLGAAARVVRAQHDRLTTFRTKRREATREEYEATLNQLVYM